jgi:hypothetical protein
MDPYFNAAGKAPHLDAVIVKKEVGWFQLQEEKRQKKNAEKLALQREKEHLAKDAADAKNQLASLSQLIQSRLEGYIDALFLSNVQVPLQLPSLSIPVPLHPGVFSVAIPLARGASGSQSSPYIPRSLYLARRSWRVCFILESQITHHCLY